MPGGGIEPPRAEARRILSPLRLPVPPSRRRKEYVKITHRLVYASPIGNLMLESHVVIRLRASDVTTYGQPLYFQIRLDILIPTRAHLNNVCWPRARNHGVFRELSFHLSKTHAACQ